MGRPGHVSSPSIRKPSIQRQPKRHRTSSSHSLIPFPLLVVLRLLVVLIVIWYEYGSFWWSVRKCKWDDSPSLKGVTLPPINNTTSTLEDDVDDERDYRWLIDPDRDSSSTLEAKQPFHALILADPQLLDMRSYPGRSWFLRWLGLKVTDMYAKKSWRMVAKRSRGTGGRGVDGVVWLGDLLDSGVESMDEAEHNAYVHRFHLLFPLPRSSSPSHAHLAPPIPSILLPGNHDLGLHLPSSSLASYARERFQNSFGAPNGEKEWGGWSLVWVDSMALLEDEEGRTARGWVEDLAERPTELPRILLSHIPLYRPEGTSCGPAREHTRSIYEGSGKNYQNELDKITSEWLLRSVKPSLVYSGDDHDACIMEHDLPPGTSSIGPGVNSIRETTIKAFSMAMGIHRPGYHLLSLYPTLPSLDQHSPTPRSTFTQTNCTLPDQLGIWLGVYLPAFVILLLSLLIPRLYLLIKRETSRRKTASARSNGLPVHKHRRSLSRKLFSGGGSSVPASPNPFEDPMSPTSASSDDESLQFPTFPFPFSPQLGYNSPLDSDELPTPTTASNGGRNEAGRVRRVSRVWAWEDEKNGGGGLGGIGGGGGGGLGSFLSGGRGSFLSSGSRRLSSTDGAADDLPFFHLLGPLNRWFVRPLVRILRTVWRKIFGAQLVWIVLWLLGWVVGRPVREALRETWSVVSPGIVAWALVWLWFSF
ncbi:hypothetical protein T439DRAFT_380157 [Meredithblackwellia eburnea MCA 4105]